jgi:LysR family transcriptional regulator of abg operon
MKLTQLRHLVAIADAGSVRQAGRNLNISQSALTKSVKLLEEELGVSLLHRESHGVSPTASAAALIRRTKFIEAELQSARSEVQLIEGARIGDVTVSASPTVAVNLLPRAVLEFKRERPQIRVHIEEGIYPDILSRVRNGDVDMAVCLLRERTDDDELTFEILMKDVVVPAVRAGHPLTKVRRLNLSDLAKREWIIFGRQGNVKAVFDHMFHEAGLEPPTSTIDCSSLTCALALAENSEYVVLVPRQIFSDRHRTWTLVPLQLQATMPSWTIGVVTRAKTQLSPACQEFLSKLRDCSKRHGK